MLGDLSAVSHDCLVAGACLYTGTRELCEGGKERCRIKEEISSGAHQHFKRSKPHTHATTHISTGHGNVRVSVWQTHHQQAACSLIGHHCHYYWANHLACPLHTAPLCCSCFVFFPPSFSVSFISLILLLKCFVHKIRIVIINGSTCFSFKI